MTYHSFFTVDATSKIADRIEEALKNTDESTSVVQKSKLQDIQKRIENLKSRGLLKKQRYVFVTTADFEKRKFNARRSQ